MIHVLFGTHSGNSEDLATELSERIEQAGHEVEVIDLGDDHDASVLDEVEAAFFIVSTWGEGDPPQDVQDFFDDLKKREPMGLTKMSFGVLALGDKSYENFCGFGKSLEKELLRHGADQVVERIDCDVFFDDDYEEWAGQVMEWVADYEG